MANFLALFQKHIDRAANQFRHRQPGLFRALAQGCTLLVGEVKVNPLHMSCALSLGQLRHGGAEFCNLKPHGSKVFVACIKGAATVARDQRFPAVHKRIDAFIGNPIRDDGVGRDCASDEPVGWFRLGRLGCRLLRLLCRPAGNRGETRQANQNVFHTPIIHTLMVLSIGLFLFLSAPVTAQEIAVPTTPVVTTITSYKVTGFALEREPDWRFRITYQDSNGKVYTDEHYGPSVRQTPTGPVDNPDGADVFLKQLNTMNFSTTSLTKRLLQHLVQHGKIPAATVTGTPETDK